MTNVPDFDDRALPAFPRGVRLHWDKVRDAWFLLAPERALALDQIAAAVLREVDGATSVGEIVGRLATAYDAPRAQVAGDVQKLFRGLAMQRALEARGE